MAGSAGYIKNPCETVESCVEKLLSDKNCSQGFRWANWLLTRVFNREQKIQYAVFAAEQAIDIYEKKYPTDKRPRAAIEAAKKCITDKSAAAAAYAAAAAAAYAADAAYAAAAAAAAAAADGAADGADDKWLTMSAELALEVLRELNSPGCAYV